MACTALHFTTNCYLQLLQSSACDHSVAVNRVVDAFLRAPCGRLSNAERHSSSGSNYAPLLIRMSPCGGFASLRYLRACVCGLRTSCSSAQARRQLNARNAFAKQPAHRLLQKPTLAAYNSRNAKLAQQQQTRVQISPFVCKWLLCVAQRKSYGRSMALGACARGGMINGTGVEIDTRRATCDARLQ